ncbi:MAG: MaoC family dehydratase N-terminal domain-containing protein [Candidatus Dormibacter sp.]
MADDVPVASELVGTTTAWEPMVCEATRVAQFAEIARLPSQTLSAGKTPLPPTYLVAQHVDTGALGIPDAPIRLNGGNWYRADHPAQAGEALERSTRVVEVVRKQGRSGVLVMYELEISCRRVADGALVATNGHTTIRRYPTAAGSERRAASPGPPKNASRAPAAAEPPAGVAVLEVVPSSRDLVRYAAATGDFYEAHYDQAFARSRGFPDIIVHGLLKLAWFATAALDHVGGGYSIHDVRASYRGTDLVGRAFTVWCATTAGAAGEGPLEVRLTGVSADGTISTVGSASLSR